MPWYLHYAGDSDGNVLRNTHRALFAASKDVYRVDVKRLSDGGVPVPGDVGRLNSDLVLVTVFRDEDRQTEDPALTQIGNAHRQVVVGPIREPGLFPNRNGDILPDVRNQIIAQAIGTAGGRSRLAAAMVAPLRARRDYTSVARRSLMVEELPQGALPTYEQDIGVTEAVLSGLGMRPEGFDAPPSSTAARRVVVPEFEMVSNPTVRLDEIQQRRYSLLERHGGYDANGSPLPPFELPEWLHAGQWVHSAKEDTYALIDRVTGDASRWYVGINYWRPNSWRVDDVISAEAFVTRWRPCEKPPEPRPSWERLMGEELF